MREIVEQLGRPPQAILVATSTTGTLQGCQPILRAADADTCVVAVDAVGSILFGGEAGPRTLPGFGASVLPALASSASPDLIVRVDDVDCVVGCRRFARAESLLVGASAGGVVTALEREIGRWANPRDDIVIVLHDGGARYLKTVYDDTWVEANLGLSASSVADRVVDAARVA